ncbi:hypothetical protein KR093_004572 [Drosophila rubida]|uniref:UBC core domain-containing protein n=1 Tax=Drosophila rubida TaxID=30044 RepID=A0AAD4K4F7_9MUSC|nr:hypothetical protein KR093_004572 [Drosophila rubida]
MACLTTQKLEIELLQQIFPKDHERFQLLDCNLDDLMCRFIDGNGKHYDIQASITDSYPMTPPVWYSECEDSSLSKIMEELADTKGQKNHVVLQVELLVRQLCAVHNVPLPNDMEKLAVPLSEEEQQAQLDNDLSIGGVSDAESESEDNYSLELEKTSSCDELELKLEETLKKLVIKHRHEHTKGAPVGSPNATDRLMKELRIIYRSDTFKQNMYSVELVNDSLYEWNVSINTVDKDSQLCADMLQLKEIDGQGVIKLNITFNDNYPFFPPFVRVVYPIILGGYVLSGGAICMELLTNSGWTSAYTVEALIIQIAATLVHGKGRINLNVTTSSIEEYYNLDRAQRSFQSILKIHSIHGWSRPARRDS